MKTEQVIEELAAAGIYLAVEQGKLLCKARKGALTPERRVLIAERKQDFIAFLRLGASRSVSAEPLLMAHGDGPVALSPTQRRLWFLDQLTESGATYAIPVTYQLRGSLDVAALRQALSRITERHESLRTVIERQDGEPMAVVREGGIEIGEPESVEAMDTTSQDELIHARLQAALLEPWDLSRETPLRVRLYRLAPDVHVMMLILNHIAADGWSVENLLRELSVLYAAFAANAPDPLPPLVLQYADYAIWQGKWLQGDRLQRELAYWRTKLSDAPVVHGLPLDRPRPAHPTHAGASWRQRLPLLLHQRLLELGRQQGATLFMTLQAAFAVLLSRWSGDTDVVIGTPVANRPRQELAPLIGFFANTLGLRTPLSGDPTFVDVLHRVRTTALDAYDHQHLPFELLVEDINPPRSAGLAPLVQIMFSLQDIDEDGSLNLPGIVANAMVPDACIAKFDLNLSMFETPDGLDACWDYSRELFDGDTIARMGEAFAALLQGIVAMPTRRIGQLPLLDAAGRRRALALGNDTTCPYPDKVCLHQLIESQVRRNPDAIAVSLGDETLSYDQLNRQANRLAHHLRTLGVGPDVPVAIVMERCPAQLVALLSIMKAGGAYVPMEPDYPAPRLEFLLADSAPVAVLVHGRTSERTSEILATLDRADRPRLLDLDADASEWANESTADPSATDVGLTSTHLAYIIYTSGSTGRPKGVMNEHRGVVNRMLWMQGVYPHGVGDKVLQKTPISFDVSVREIFLTLLAGAQLVMARPDGHKDPAYLINLIRHDRINIVGFVPSMLQAFLEHPRVGECRCITRIFCGGETLPGSLVRRCREAFPRARLHNLYGPTEAAVSVTAWDCPDGALPDIIPIGKAGANTRIYILDPLGQPVPRGMRGEIHIAGCQVARGYLNRPELSAERFVADPYGAGPNARMYRTGDLGRQHADGHIEYLGRNDFQTKIRGQRVELGEIEAQLQSCRGVRQVSVQVRKDSQGDLRLVAYIVADDGSVADDSFIDSLRRHVRAQLPPHMLPAAYVSLGQLPLTANGKLDTKALAAPDITAYTVVEYVPPSTPVEERLVAVWTQLLGHERIGVTANFFDLGGHSLLLTRLQNQLGAHYGVELALRQLFMAQTIREQAVLIESMQARPVSATAPAPRRRPADAGTVLSFAQQRLWIIDQMGNAGAVYNIPCALRLSGPLQPEALQNALVSIVRRHEVLRTPLAPVAGEARPRLLEHFELTMPLHDFRELDGSARAEAVRVHVDAEVSRPFDLATDLFLRAQLLRVADDEHVLLLTLHHIAADGWSMVVLLQELAKLYVAETTGCASPLPTLPLQYADYAHWQQQWLQGDRLEQQLRYWRSQLDSLPVRHNLPLDFVRPDIQRYRGAIHWQRFRGTLPADIKHLARSRDATLFMLLHTAFAVLLARWSGDTDIVVGTPIANRRHEELAPLIGFFVNTLVLRSDLSANPRFIDALAAAREVALDAFQHQDLPFEMLVDRLNPQRSLSHSPLFQVMFVLDNNGSAVIPFGGLDVTDVAGDSQYAKFDLTLSVREVSDGLDACWEYNRDLFHAATVGRIAASFEALLYGIVADPEQRIQRLPLLAAEARHAIAVSGPQRALPPVSGVHVLFEARAVAQPDTVAVRDGSQSISYADLNRRANRVAHALRVLGVGPDRRVAVHTERSIDTYVGILAVMKAGGAYVALDTAHPIERRTDMMVDSGAMALLTQTGLRNVLPECGVPELCLDDEAWFSSNPSTNPVVPGLQQHHLGYVVYTSGSTGKPKGVMVEHAGILNMVNETACRLGDDGPIETVWWSSVGFDGAVFEMLPALAMGASVHIVPEEIRVDVDAYLEWLTTQRITQAYLPPFIVRRLRDCSDARIAALSLRRLLVAVEPLQESGLYRLQRLLPNLVIVNAYGPSEATVYATCYTNIRDLPRNAPIGRPIANTRILVLDDAMQPVPEGVVGEIHIVGVGVARGYLNQPGQTADRFRQTHTGERIYRTGDLARWLSEGELEFRGRSDLQFKLNGVRIEPGEIEAILVSHAHVREAVVVMRADHGPDDKKLVAYLVSDDGFPVPVQSLREHLVRHLPPYMLPSAYVTVDELPLTVNGKLDVRALPIPDLTAYTSTDYAPPDNAMERQLVEIWQGLLQHQQIGVTTNFFELGGNSLNAVRLMSRVRDAFGKSLPISILFNAPTIRALAAQIKSHEAAADESFMTLRAGGESTPLFLFHAAGGDVLCYQPLLRYLPADMPIHGFHRQELPNQRVPMLRSIEQLADEYVPRMLQEQPEGAYYLAGWSSGGVLALEIASRLEKLGRPVGLVMLVDTMLPAGTALPRHFHERGLPALAELTPQSACDVMREFDPTLPQVIPKDGVLDVPATDYFNYLVAANHIGIDFYQAHIKVAATVYYFGCALNQNFKTEDQRVAEIQDLLEKPIIRESFEATHFTVMEEPRAGELGRAMACAIARCMQGGAPATVDPVPLSTTRLQEAGA